MPAPVKHTCPDIDKVIKMLKSIAETAKYGMKYSKGEDEKAYDMFKDCEWDIDNIIDKMEELRSANHDLRTWGEDLEEEKESFENYIAELEAKLQTATKETTY